MSATTTTFSFVPSDTAVPPFSFEFATEGDTYTAQCTWNFANQGWYLQIFDSSQNLAINHPLISSPVATPQNLAPGIFSNSIIYYTQNIAQITLVESTVVSTTIPPSVPYLGQFTTVTISINDVAVSV